MFCFWIDSISLFVTICVSVYLFIFFFFAVVFSGFCYNTQEIDVIFSVLWFCLYLKCNPLPFNNLEIFCCI